MTENEYKKWVLAVFDQKFAQGQLPPELTSPSPGSIKAQCIKVFGKGITKREEVLLSSFLGEKEKGDTAAYLRALQKVPYQVFKPLDNFLEDRNIDTKFKNIELLAWLIGFEPRPFHTDLKPPENLLQQIETDEETKRVQGTEQAPQGQPTSIRPGLARRSNRKLIAYCSLLVVFCLGIFYIGTHQPGKLTGKEGCMIWDNDHYQPVQCNDKSVHAAVYSIDRRLVEQQRKIDRPDTLTPYSIDRVWYINYKGRVEFFTAGGAYPPDTDRRLLPMSDRILRKYVYHVAN